MKLTDEQIKEFHDVYEKEKCKKISKKEAVETAHNLIGFFRVIYDCEMRKDR
jgi:hypothetical protein